MHKRKRIVNMVILCLKTLPNIDIDTDKYMPVAAASIDVKDHYNVKTDHDKTNANDVIHISHNTAKMFEMHDDSCCRPIIKSLRENKMPSQQKCFINDKKLLKSCEER